MLFMVVDFSPVHVRKRNRKQCMIFSEFGDLPEIYVKMLHVVLESSLSRKRAVSMRYG